MRIFFSTHERSLGCFQFVRCLVITQLRVFLYVWLEVSVWLTALPTHPCIHISINKFQRSSTGFGIVIY